MFVSPSLNPLPSREGDFKMPAVSAAENFQYTSKNVFFRLETGVWICRSKASLRAGLDGISLAAAYPSFIAATAAVTRFEA